MAKDKTIDSYQRRFLARVEAPGSDPFTGGVDGAGGNAEGPEPSPGSRSEPSSDPSSDLGGPRRWFRLTRVRIASQAVFFVLFVLAVWATWTSRLGGYPVSRLLELDPLVTLSTALATGYVYKFLGWGLLLVVVTFVFGRVFCNWMCPYGTLHQLVSWLFDVRGNSQRIRANGYHRLQYLRV